MSGCPSRVHGGEVVPLNRGPFHLLPLLRARLMAVVVAIRLVENVRLVHKSLLSLFYLPLLLNKIRLIIVLYS